MRSHNGIYVHPDLKADEEDVTLITTVCFVLSFAVVGAVFIVTLSCLLREDCYSCELPQWHRFSLRTHLTYI